MEMKICQELLERGISELKMHLICNRHILQFYVGLENTALLEFRLQKKNTHTKQTNKQTKNTKKHILLSAIT